MNKRRFKPSPELRECSVCGRAESRIRYFVAVPLPKIMFLCQNDYERVKEEAKNFVKEFLE